MPEAAQKASKPASGFAVVGNGWSVHDRFPSDAAIRTHLDATGTATILRAAGMVGNTILWRPQVKAYSVQRLRKARNPNDATDFVLMIEREARRLAKISGDTVDDTMGDIYGRLDASWASLPDDQREKVLQRVLQDMEDHFPTADLTDTIGAAATTGATATIKSSATTYQTLHDMPAAFAFGPEEGEAASIIGKTASNYVTTIQGQLQGHASNLARTVVEEGMKAGLGPEEIALELQAKLAEVTGRTQLNYYRVVANTYMQRARSFGQLSAMGAGGITTYQIEAILDNVTTDMCRFLHGKRFSVTAGMDIIRGLGALANPQDIVTAQPWLRTMSRGGFNDIMAPTSGGLLAIARITRSGVGVAGDVGAYTPFPGAQALPNINVGPPPYHGG